MRALPIAQYPEIAPPVVTVQAVYPGASADVLEKTVASPLENAINGVPDMIYMSSHSSSNGVLSIEVTFEIGAHIDDAALNVNNRVKQVEPRLPEEVRRQGVTVERGSSSFLQVLAFYAPDGRYDDLFTSNYVTLNVLDALKRVPGTTSVQIFGARDYAMRVWAAPRPAGAAQAHHRRRRARAERAERAVSPPARSARRRSRRSRTWSTRSRRRAGSPTPGSSATSSSAPTRTGRPCALPTWRGSNWARRTTILSAATTASPPRSWASSCSRAPTALAVAASVRATTDRLAERFPAGLAYAIPYDTTRFVEASIREVVFTLGEAMLLVFLVVYLFLQTWRATVIPLVAVPVSLLGTFAGLLVLGYSINTLTLFGMVLAIGIVVDDAIVVLENVERSCARRAPSRAKPRSRRCTR